MCTRSLNFPASIPFCRGHLHHFTYENADDRAERCARYAELWARTAQEEHRRANRLSAPLHAFARLFKGFVLKAGFLDGAVGWDNRAGQREGSLAEV